MVTVLVADDEQATCKSLVRNVEWEKLQLRLIACVSNGQEAIKYLEDTPPDILITDISMPIMSGLELAKYIYERKLPVKVILLSGYQEFEYAQQGIRYNVSNYMLKPCEKQQINEALKELAESCICEKKELLEKQYFETFLDNCKPQLCEKLWLDLLHGNITNEESLTQKCLFLDIDTGLEYYVIVIEVDNIKENFESLEERQKIYVALHLSESFTALLSTKEQTVVLSLTEGRYVALVPQCATEDIVSVCNSVRESFYSYTGLSATFGIGGSAVALLQLRKAYEKAKETLLYKYLVGKNSVICHEDITTITAHETHLIDTISVQTQIVRAVRSGDLEMIQGLCGEWFDILENCNPTLVKSLIVQFVGNLSVELLGAGISLTELFGDENLIIEKVLRFDTIFDVKLWLKQILEYICSYIGEKNQKSTALLVRKATQFIDKHYAENINVDVVAKHVCLSSGYLMTIFKKEMGVSIISYLTEKRMNVAKELLLESEYKIYKIAGMVGYSNATFFSSTFRNHVGMSPKRFKECYQVSGSIITE